MTLCGEKSPDLRTVVLSIMHTGLLSLTVFVLQQQLCQCMAEFMSKQSALSTTYIGLGAGPAGPVLAGPLFRRFNEIH